MVPTNLKLNTCIRGLLGLSLGTLIGRRTSPARGISKKQRTAGQLILCPNKPRPIEPVPRIATP
jgi:hypothetical protein